MIISLIAGVLLVLLLGLKLYTIKNPYVSDNYSLILAIVAIIFLSGSLVESYWNVPLFGIVAALIVLTYTTLVDIRTREIPDEWSMGLIVFSLLVSAFISYSIGSFDAIVSGLVGWGVAYVFGYTLYRMGQWGGGDTKILEGLGALHGFWFGWNFMIYFVLNILFVGAMYGIGYAVYLAVKKWDKMQFDFRYAKYSTVGILFIWLIGFVIVPFSFAYVGLLFLLLLIPFTHVFLKGVQEKGMMDDILVEKLTEGDWLVDDVVVDGKIIVKRQGMGLSLDDITKLKKANVKSVALRIGMAFMPSIFLAYVLTLVIKTHFLGLF